MLISDSEQTSFLNEILIIIVLYETSINDSSTYQSLKKIPNHPHLFFFDNSLQKQQDIFIDNTEYYHDSSNPGVSKAYNEGAKRAEELGKKWLLLADQDSVFPDAYFKELFNAVKNNPSMVLFAPMLIANDKIISPCNFYLGRGSNVRKIDSGINFLNNRSLLNSGIFIRRETFADLGGYDEKIKLDFSDHAFIEKYKRKQKTFYLLPVEIEHSFSAFVNNKEQSKTRYKYYCDGACLYANSITLKIFIRLWLFLRGLKLTYGFKDFSFLICFFRHLSF